MALDNAPFSEWLKVYDEFIDKKSKMLDKDKKIRNYQDNNK